MIQPSPLAGFSIRCLGTGNAFSSSARLSAGTLFSWPGATVLVDPGPGALVALERIGVAIGSLDAILVTHLHGDHIVGLPFLAMKHAYVEHGRGQAMVVHGPVGMKERARVLWEATYPDASRCPQPTFHEFPAGATFAVAGAEIATVAMAHLPHSIGFRLSHGGHRVAISGDTAFAPCVGELCVDTDLTLLECTLHEPAPYAHVSLAEVRAGRTGLGVTRLVLHHLDDSIAAAFAQTPIAATSIASDGSVFEVGG